MPESIDAEASTGQRVRRTLPKLLLGMVPLSLATIAAGAGIVVGVLVGVQFLFNGCRPPGPSAEARQREQTLRADTVAVVVPPGGQLLNEYSSPGHDQAAPFSLENPTVTREYRFDGDPHAVAIALLGQLRTLGWSVSASCTIADHGVYFVYGKKQLPEFTERVEFQIWTRPAWSGGHGIPESAATPTVTETLSAPYPGRGDDRSPDYPAVPTCAER